MYHVLGLSRPWKQTRNYSKQKKRLNNGGHGSLGGHFWDPNPTGRSQRELAMAFFIFIVAIVSQQCRIDSPYQLLGNTMYGGAYQRGSSSTNYYSVLVRTTSY